MLPELIKKIIEKEEEGVLPIDECRVVMNEQSINITHYQEVPGKLATVIEKNRKDILNRVKLSLPECINIQTLPVKRNKHTTLCVCLTIEVSNVHNTIKELNTLSEMADAANTAVCRSYDLENILENIHKDMKPFYE